MSPFLGKMKKTNLYKYLVTNLCATSCFLAAIVLQLQLRHYFWAFHMGHNRCQVLYYFSASEWGPNFWQNNIQLVLIVLNGYHTDCFLRCKDLLAIVIFNALQFCSLLDKTFSFPFLTPARVIVDLLVMSLIPIHKPHGILGAVVFQFAA